MTFLASSRRFSPGLAAALLVLLAPVAASRAQVTPNGDDFQANTYTTSIQVFPRVAADAAGGFVATWSSSGSDGSDSRYISVQARRFSAIGVPLEDDFQVNSYTIFNQYFSDVGVGEDGGFVVTWTSHGSTGSDSDYQSVQARRFAADGTPLGDDFQVNGYTTGIQWNSRVAVDSKGKFLVVWVSDGSDGTDTSSGSIQARLYGSDGQPATGELQVNSYTTGDQGFPAVAADPQGGFVVAWASAGSDGTDTSSDSIQAQRFEDDGAPLGPQFQVNSYTPYGQSRPEVAFDGAGHFVVVWQGSGSDASDGNGRSVHAQFYETAGPAIGGEIQVNEYTTGDQERPAVAADARGDFVVTWTSQGSSGSDSDLSSVQARLYGADATPLGAEFQVNTYTTGVQNSVVVASDPHGDLAVVWQSDGSGGQRHRHSQHPGPALRRPLPRRLRVRRHQPLVRDPALRDSASARQKPRLFCPRQEQRQEQRLP